MASVVDICNLALSNMWQDAVITEIYPPDGTIEAQYASVFYPVARDELLEMHAWHFATTRVSLAKYSTNEAEESWGYSYSLPSDAIKPLIVLLPEAASDIAAQRHELETRADGQIALYTDVDDAVLKYVRRVTDTTRYTPLFITTLSFLLAQYMAGPITKNKKTVESMKDLFISKYVLATAADASSRRKDMLKSHVPAHIAARRV